MRAGKARARATMEPLKTAAVKAGRVKRCRA